MIFERHLVGNEIHEGVDHKVVGGVLWMMSRRTGMLPLFLTLYRIYVRVADRCGQSGVGLFEASLGFSLQEGRQSIDFPTRSLFVIVWNLEVVPS